MKSAGFGGAKDFAHACEVVCGDELCKGGFALEISPAFLLLKWEKQFGTVKSLA